MPGMRAHPAWSRFGRNRVESNSFRVSNDAIPERKCVMCRECLITKSEQKLHTCALPSSGPICPGFRMHTKSTRESNARTCGHK